MKILVTQERYDEVFSIEEWLNFGQMTNQQVYERMLQFVVDDEGKPVSEKEAREYFKGFPKKEWSKVLGDFIQAVDEAFINPTSGSSSGAPLSAEPDSIPDGSAS